MTVPIERRTQDLPVAVERRKRKFLIIRVTAEEHQRLASVASLNGMDQSTFVRQAVDSAALDCTDDPVFGV